MKSILSKTRTRENDYKISIEDLCNTHIKPILHLITNTIYKEDYSKIKTINIQKWLTTNQKSINDIRIFLGLPLIRANHIGYDFFDKKTVYSSQQEMIMANILYKNLHPDYDYISHKRYPKEFYKFIGRKDRSYSFRLDFTIIEKKTKNTILNIEVWQNTLEQANKKKESGYKQRMVNYCIKQGGRNDKENFWKEQNIPFLGVDRKSLVTKKGILKLLEILKKFVKLEEKELSKEFLNEYIEKVKNIKKVGNSSGFSEIKPIKKIYTDDEIKEFEDDMKIIMNKNEGEIPVFSSFKNNKSCLGPTYFTIVKKLYEGRFTELCKRLGDERKNTKKKLSINNKNNNILRCHGLKPNSTEDDIKDVFCKIFIDFLNTKENGSHYSQKQWKEYSELLPHNTHGRASEGRVYRTHLGNLKNPWKNVNNWFEKFSKDSIEWAKKKNIKIPKVYLENIKIFIDNLNKFKLMLDNRDEGLGKSTKPYTELEQYLVNNWYNSHKAKFSTNSGIFKRHPETIKIWKDFINSEKYKIKLLSGIEKNKYNLECIKKYYNTNGKLPSSTSNDHRIAFLGRLHIRMKKNLKEHLILNNQDLTNAWKDFLEYVDINSEWNKNSIK